MKFCAACDNMMYVRVDEHTTYMCKFCGFSEELDTKSQICITDTKLKNDESVYRRYISPYLRSDATVPHVSNVQCPNPKCNRKDDQPNDVMVIKYDKSALKYVYVCTHCNYTWVTRT